MTAFLIADVEVTDPAGYEEYKKGVSVTIAAYQGKYLARGGATVVLEGDWLPSRAVIIEFPSIERLRAWYDSPEYEPLKHIRMRTAKSRMLIIDGV